MSEPMSKDLRIVSRVVATSFVIAVAGFIIMATGQIWGHGTTEKVGQTMAAVGGIVFAPAFIVGVLLASGGRP